MNEDLLIEMRRKAHKDAVVEVVFGIIFTLAFVYGLSLWLSLVNGPEENSLGWIFAMFFGLTIAIPMVFVGGAFGIPNLISGIYGLIASKYEERLLKNRIYYLVMGIVYVVLAVATIGLAIWVGSGDGGNMLTVIAAAGVVDIITVVTHKGKQQQTTAPMEAPEQPDEKEPEGV